MKLPDPYRACWCRDPETGRLLGKSYPELERSGHGGWYARYEVPRADDRRSAHHLAQGAARRAVAWGPGWTDSGRVFTREDGKPLRPGWISQRFGVLAARADLPPIRFRDLRHGTATMLLAAGQPIKVISEILGHATSAFTADVYTEVAEELADAAAVALAAYIPPCDPSSIPVDPLADLIGPLPRRPAVESRPDQKPGRGGVRETQLSASCR